MTVKQTWSYFQLNRNGIPSWLAAMLFEPLGRNDSQLQSGYWKQAACARHDVIHHQLELNGRYTSHGLCNCHIMMRRLPGRRRLGRLLLLSSTSIPNDAELVIMAMALAPYALGFRATRRTILSVSPHKMVPGLSAATHLWLRTLSFEPREKAVYYPPFARYRQMAQGR